MPILLTLGHRGLLLASMVLAAGCTNHDAAPPPARKAPVAQRPARKDDAGHPLVKEARPDTEAVLTGLLAGKYDADPDFAPIAQKLKGYSTWVITAQEPDPDNRNAVHFDGTLSGPAGEATFTAYMVKQQSGRWMIGSFSGPTRK